jgi:hypothetical protein
MLIAGHTIGRAVTLPLPFPGSTSPQAAVSGEWRTASPGMLSCTTFEFRAGAIAGFGACLILWWVADRHRRNR